MKPADRGICSLYSFKTLSPKLGLVLADATSSAKPRACHLSLRPSFKAEEDKPRSRLTKQMRSRPEQTMVHFMHFGHAKHGKGTRKLEFGYATNRGSVDQKQPLKCSAIYLQALVSHFVPGACQISAVWGVLWFGQRHSCGGRSIEAQMRACMPLTSCRG